MAAKNKKKELSWATVIIVMILCWPIGLYLLYKKATSNKTAMLKNAKILRIPGWIFVGIALIYVLILTTEGAQAAENGSSVVTPLLIMIIIFGGFGLRMLYRAKKMRINGLRYQKYIQIVINGRVTYIDNIASAIPVTPEIALKDLQDMINIGYFENAYLDLGRRELVWANMRGGIYPNYQMHPVIMNAPRVQEVKIEKKVVACRNCGANNQITTGRVFECEFCGSLIQE